MENRERIQVKAYELFMRYGIRSVSMDDIAAQLGMSKKTIYQFFADKDELVSAVVEQEVGNMQQDCVRSSQKSRDAIHEIFLTMEQVSEQFRHLNPVVLYDLEKFHHPAYGKFLKYRNEFLLEIISANLKRGIQEELYRPELEVDIIARFRLESMMIAFNIDLYPTRKFDLRQVIMELFEHFLYGLVTLKGYRLIQKYKKEHIIKISSDEK